MSGRFRPFSICVNLDRDGRRSGARYVGGEEVDAVAVEVAAGAVVVLGGARIGVAGQDLDPEAVV
jgi:hypothetical protein